MKRNVLFLNQSSEMYGSDKVLLHMVTGLQQTGKFHPIVVVPSGGELVEALKSAGIETHVAVVGKVSRSSFSVLGAFRLVWELARALRPIDRIVGGREIAVVHSNSTSVLGGALWSRLRRKRHVWHVHEIVLSPRFVGWMYAYLIDAFAERVVFISNAVQTWLVGINPRLSRKSALVFNGLPHSLIPARGRFRNSMHLESDHLLVTLAGRINRWKGHGLLVEAVDTLRRAVDLSRVRFAIVGSTVAGQQFLKEELLAEIRRRGLEEYFLFVPFTRDIDQVWADSDIAVVPSIEPEPFGMVAIEAMAAGVPVVAAAHGGLLDIVSSGCTGLVFEPRSADELAKALGTLLSDGNLRRRYGAAGRLRQVECFSLGAQLSGLSKVYSQLTGCAADLS